MKKLWILTFCLCLLATTGMSQSDTTEKGTNSSFAILNGNGLDRNVEVGVSTNRDVHLFYVFNPCWWPVRVELVFKQDGEIKDIDSGKPVDLKAGKMQFVLSGYAVKHFSTTDADIPAQAEASVDSPKAREYLQSRMRLFDTSDEMNPDDVSLAFRILKMDKSELDKRISQAKAALQDGNLLLARNLLRNDILERWFDFLREREYIRNFIPAELDLPESIRINCGSPQDHVDGNGLVWVRDRRLSPHEFILGLETWGAEDGNAGVRGPVGITGTEDETLFRSERYNVSGYLFRLKNGSYTIRLYFAETWHKAFKPGGRVFDIAINGDTVASSFDPAATAGGGKIAVIKEFEADVTNGVLSIGFTQQGGIGQPIVNAVEILPIAQEQPEQGVQQ